MEFLTWLQDSPVSIWVVESESVWAYPTILALHTFGLAILVGANTVIDFRLLGLIRAAPLGELRKLFGPMWVGLAINTVTGLLLWAASARVKTFVIMFWVKLAFIALALIVLVRTQRFMDSAEAKGTSIPAAARQLAVLSLVFWSGAMIAGRLMAYLEWEWRFLGEG